MPLENFHGIETELRKPLPTATTDSPDWDKVIQAEIFNI